MRCFRIFVFTLLMLVTACAACANLFPQFRDTTTVPDATRTRYLWYSQTSSKDATTRQVSVSRLYCYDVVCAESMGYNTAAAALSVAGAALGGAATLFAACYINSVLQANLAITSVLATFLGMACCVVALAIEVLTYTTSHCSGELTQVTAGKEAGYKIAEGFILLAVAAGGMFVCFIMGFVSCCCSLCSDDDDKDYDY